MTKNATVSATVESIVLNRIARLTEAASFCSCRLCTSAECRYRLCGMTVAPMIPIAT